MLLSKEFVYELYSCGVPPKSILNILGIQQNANETKRNLVGSYATESQHVRVLALHKERLKKKQLKAESKGRVFKKDNSGNKKQKQKRNKKRSYKKKPAHLKLIPELRGIKTKNYCHPLLGKPEYNKFYSSTAWRQLRYLALKNAGGCQCCGAKASDGVQIHVDHIKPRSKYPELELSLDNIQTLCSDCNIGKGAWDETDWR